MIKKILIVEDNGILYQDIKKELVSDYEVYQATSYITALGYWERENRAFDCIVLDLQINPIGLDCVENDKYTPYIGYAVLEAFAQNMNSEEETLLRKKIIIYSGYAQGFINDNRKFNVNHLEILHKRGNSIKDLIRTIKKVCSKQN